MGPFKHEDRNSRRKMRMKAKIDSNASRSNARNEVFDRIKKWQREYEKKHDKQAGN